KYSCYAATRPPSFALSLHDALPILSRVAALLSDPQRSFEHTLRAMMATNHLGSDAAPQAHPVVAAVARELLNKSDNERSGVLSTATSFLALYRDPLIAAMTSSCDWRINDLVEADQPVSLYLVIPPSDISRSKPLVRLVLNQIGRRLTEQLTPGQSDGGSAEAPVQMPGRAGDRKHQL